MTLPDRHPQLSSPTELDQARGVAARYIIIGAGAVGVTFAAELQRAGKDVLVIARGGQLDALRAGTLRYARPDGTRNLAIPAAAGPGEVTLAAGDVLVLTTKTQDADRALADWAWRPVRPAGGGESRPAAAALPVITVQNGLDAERSALRRFATVIGGMLWVAAGYVASGEVAATSWPAVGIAWLGSYPHGAHPLLERVAGDFSAAGFLTHVVEDIQAVKAAKLIASATFALSALYQPGALRDRATALLADEARDVLTASGYEIADLQGQTAGELDRIAPRPTDGPQYTGNSTSQSLSRSAPVETDFLNGEIVLAARLLARSAPANEAIAERVHRALAAGTPAGSLDDHDLLATLPQLADDPEPARGHGPALDLEPAGDHGSALDPEPARGHEPAFNPEPTRGHGPAFNPELAPGTGPGGRDGVLIDAAALHALLGGPRPPLVLDVRWALGDSRGREHYRDGHIPSAVYADLDTQLAASPSRAEGRHPLPAVEDLQKAARSWGLHAGQPIVVYDDSGGLAAARAWWLLRWAGVADVRILDGALAAWRRAGYELEAGEQHPVEGDAVLTAGHLPVLSADAAAAAGASPGRLLLDARASERYRGESEPVDPRAGHIPGAVSAPTTGNLADDGAFAATAALRARFAALGAAPGVPVGVYCGSGVTAAHEIAALAIAGIDAALYPGSWSAWSADPARPAATGADPAGDGPPGDGPAGAAS